MITLKTKQPNINSGFHSLHAAFSRFNAPTLLDSCSLFAKGFYSLFLKDWNTRATRSRENASANDASQRANDRSRGFATYASASSKAYFTLKKYSRGLFTTVYLALSVKSRKDDDFTKKSAFILFLHRIKFSGYTVHCSFN